MSIIATRTVGGWGGYMSHYITPNGSSMCNRIQCEHMDIST